MPYILTVVIPLSALLVLALVCAVMAYTGSLSKIIAPRFSWAPPSYWPCELVEGWEQTCFACRGGVTC